MIFRLGWMFGFVSTREYSARTRSAQFGPGASDPTDAALSYLERRLVEDRVAIVLFLIGLIILAYTFLNAPA